MWKRADEHEVSRFDNTIVGDWTDGCERAPKNKRNIDTIFPQLPLMSCDLLPTLVLSLKVTRQKSQQVHRENSETYCYMLQYGIAKLALAAFAAALRLYEGGRWRPVAPELLVALGVKLKLGIAAQAGDLSHSEPDQATLFPTSSVRQKAKRPRTRENSSVHLNLATLVPA